MFKLHLTVDRYADIRKHNNPTEFKSTVEAAAQPVLFLLSQNNNINQDNTFRD